MGHRTIRNHCLSAFAALAALLLPAQAQAWGFYAHRVTAEIAEANLRPETRAEIGRLLEAAPLLGTPDCALDSLADASVWADCVRRDRDRWGYTAQWHYKTAPICEEYSAFANCPGGACVNGQIERAMTVLSRRNLPDNVRLEALAWLVHFTGDIHMPLHSGDKDDRGGNDRETDYGIVPSLNLHWIWDGPMAERAITSAQPALVRRYDSAERAALAGGTPADWGRESWQLSRELVYPTAFDTDDPCAGDLPGKTALTQEDIVAQLPALRRRVQQAGLRIADMLDEALGPAQASERGVRSFRAPPRGGD
ncbi:MAG: S1/P1 nuclease [Erythrobacter sp.]|uniref:S1/P1 nuclease n=1 Tax=Erythrobacter sp. TaxID=1042 RepID=UPI001B2E9A1D|nr:S1/P1 nuclease [Erythrobacter sp.]MBO6767547.1 S1/P1 nuclease [Erythrobacter sp.]